VTITFVTNKYLLQFVYLIHRPKVKADQNEHLSYGTITCSRTFVPFIGNLV